MTLPNEELRALKRTHQFMLDILSMRVSDFRKMSKEEFEKWRIEAYYCIKHYPFDFQLEQMWDERIKEMERSFASDKLS